MEPAGPDAALRTPAPPTSGRWDRLRVIVPFVVSAGLIAWVLESHDLGPVVQTLRRASYVGYAAVLGSFLAANLLLDAGFMFLNFRWLTGVGRFGELLRARAAALLLALVSFPIALGGLAVYARRRYDLPYKRGAAVMLNEVIQDLGAIGLVVALAGTFAPRAQIPVASIAAVRAATFLGLGSFAVYVVCFAASRAARFLPERLRRAGSVVDLFVRLRAGRSFALFSLKFLKCLAFGLFIALGLACFGLHPPILASIAFTQIVFLVRGLPVTAFGLGADQVSFPALFGHWETAMTPGRALAFSLVVTFSLLLGRAIVGLPFVAGVIDDLRERAGSSP